MKRESERISTLDLLDGRFVLLTGSDNDAWFERATEIGRSTNVPLAAYRIDPGAELKDPLNEWTNRLGVSTGGAILIRPDGFVAWRAIDATTLSAASLESVLNRILCRSTTAVNRA
jgi:putative polyketide hydroxylase